MLGLDQILWLVYVWLLKCYLNFLWGTALEAKISNNNKHLETRLKQNYTYCIFKGSELKSFTSILPSYPIQQGTCTLTPKLSFKWCPAVIRCMARLRWIVTDRDWKWWNTVLNYSFILFLISEPLADTNKILAIDRKHGTFCLHGLALEMVSKTQKWNHCVFGGMGLVHHCSVHCYIYIKEYSVVCLLVFSHCFQFFFTLALFADKDSNTESGFDGDFFLKFFYPLLLKCLPSV